MAILQVRTVGDEVLEKKCKEVKKMTPSLSRLIDDMFETMYAEGGVGLAAPQVGVLRRIIVIDVGEERGAEQYAMVNPVIVEQSGSQTGREGCLSYPGKYGDVTRPERVVVEGLDRDMQPVRVEAEGLLARAFCHETDHLEGRMYMELVEGELHDARYEDDEEYED